jgi:C1A family cysteine protease
MKYGWIRDLPDQRDYKYTAIKSGAGLPQCIDLRKSFPEVYDQGNLGSCTAQAVAAAIQFEHIKNHHTEFDPSRLFIYYNERVLEGTVNTDSGAMLRDGVKTVAQQGVCTETLWKYEIKDFKKKPTQICYQEAKNDRVIEYYRLRQNLKYLKNCLAQGYPFVFGFSVYENIDNVGKDGILNVPDLNESCLGGHAVLCVGYNDNNNRFIIRNSWGAKWGDNGHFYMPYEYVTNPELAADFWTIRQVL